MTARWAFLVGMVVGALAVFAALGSHPAGPSGPELAAAQARADSAVHLADSLRGAARAAVLARVEAESATAVVLRRPPRILRAAGNTAVILEPGADSGRLVTLPPAVARQLADDSTKLGAALALVAADSVAIGRLEAVVVADSEALRKTEAAHALDRAAWAAELTASRRSAAFWKVAGGLAVVVTVASKL